MNPKTKVYVYNRQINGRFSSFKSSVKRIARRMAQLIGAGALFYVIFMLGAFTWSTSRTEAYTNTIVVQAEAPVLERIAKCESGGHHFRNGQVVINPNKNGTVDVGLFQINSIWNKKATEMGLDLTKEADNRKFAEWMYANKGTGDWSASQACWKR